jgi:hypothetical protein
MGIMNTRRHSGFVRFDDVRKRDTFVAEVFRNDAPLEARAFMSSSQPTIVFDGLSDLQQQRVLRAVEGTGKWFDDVQFKPTR